MSGSSTGVRYGASIVRSHGIHTSGNDGGRIGSLANANGSTSSTSTSDSAAIVSSVYGSFTSKRVAQLPKTSSYSIDLHARA